MIEQTSPTQHAPSQQVLAPLAEPDPVQRPARLAMYLGVALVILGAIALYLGYNGAALNPLPQAQTPYVISGGLLGVALMVLGAITIAMHVMLRVQGDFRSEMNDMRDSIDKLADVLARQSMAAAPIAAPAASTNGNHVMVAKGATSFHRPECRLVARAATARPMPRDEAAVDGLVPCRICKP